MKLYRIEQFGSVDGLKRLEEGTPQPRGQEVLVRIRAASLNYRDLVVLRGQYDRNPQPGRVPLSDGAGEVVAVGDQVKRFKPGEAVAGCFFQGWDAGRFRREMHRTALGGGIDGVLAEFVLFHEQGLVHLPAGYTFEEGATLPCAALTAWQSLVVRGRILPGEAVLLLGTGGVSIFGLQLAKAAGARAIITSSSDEKLERARSLGADHTINYRNVSDWGRTAAELAGDEGVDHVVEVGGAGTFPESVRACRSGASIGVIGVLTGRETSVQLFTIVPKLLSVYGIYVGSREMFKDMNRTLSQARLKPVVDRVFAFEEAPHAYRYLESGAHFGKVVIRVSD
ncbi:MAG: NAD(P)-dependent alcohol dehydrogenase [Verrucomicrobia bacterium]|nr:NAD(P)-dependent alcohol dehydrogenase [Verrucomicrobiota bacterium]